MEFPHSISATATAVPEYQKARTIHGKPGGSTDRKYLLNNNTPIINDFTSACQPEHVASDRAIFPQSLQKSPFHCLHMLSESARIDLHLTNLFYF